MKYKVGQEVRISANLSERMSSPGVTGDMMRMIGQTFKITKVVQDKWYRMNNGFSWSDEMLEPVVITADEAFEQLVHGQITDAQYIQALKKINK